MRTRSQDALGADDKNYKSREEDLLSWARLAWMGASMKANQGGDGGGGGDRGRGTDPKALSLHETPRVTIQDPVRSCCL